MEYYSAVSSTDRCHNMNDLGNVAVRKKTDKKSHFVLFHLYEIYSISKSKQMESRLKVSRDWGERGMGNNCLMDTGFYFGMMKMLGIK